jgi:hypothetical protein
LRFSPLLFFLIFSFSCSLVGVLLSAFSCQRSVVGILLLALSCRHSFRKEPSPTFLSLFFPFFLSLRNNLFVLFRRSLSCLVLFVLSGLAIEASLLSCLFPRPRRDLLSLIAARAVRSPALSPGSSRALSARPSSVPDRRAPVLCHGLPRALSARPSSVGERYPLTRPCWKYFSPRALYCVVRRDCLPA